MEWQDWLFGAGSIVFGVALIPTILGPNKPHISTSLLTAGILFSYVVAFITLDLWFAAITDAAVAALWAVLAWQAWRQQMEG